MTVRLISENGISTLDKEPLAGYREGRKQGNLAKAVLYLSEMRPGDWCLWLSSKLCDAYSTLSFEMAACLACLAYVRRPTSKEKLEEWTAQLIGVEHLPGIQEAIPKLIPDEGFGNSVRLFGGNLQFNSSHPWFHIPEFEDVATYKQGDGPLAE